MNDSSSLPVEDVRNTVSAFSQQLRAATQGLISQMAHMRRMEDIDVTIRTITAADGNRFLDVVPTAVVATQPFVQAYPTVPHTIPDLFSHYTPFTHEERIMWSNEIFQRDAYLCQIEERIKELDVIRNGHFHNAMNDLSWEIQRTLTDAMGRINLNLIRVLEAHEYLLRPLQTERTLTKKRIELIQAYVAPIRKLPLELKTYIISYATTGTPQRKLALVCKEWRDIILNTPSFWCRIDTKDIKYKLRHTGCKLAAAELTQRLLQLAKGAELDIAIDYEAGNYVDWLSAVCQPLASHGVEKWRSLEIRHGSFCPNYIPVEVAVAVVNGLVTGRFECLRTLTIVTNHAASTLDTTDAFCPLYERINQTSHPLESFTILEAGPIAHTATDQAMNELSRSFQETSLLQQLKKLRVPSAFFVNSRQITLNTVDELTLTKYTGNPPITMPRTTTLWSRMEDIVPCQKDHVEKLTLHLGWAVQQNVPVTFASLKDLTLYGATCLDVLTDLVAPNLQRLAFIGQEMEKMSDAIMQSPPSSVRQFEQANHDYIDQVFKTNKDRLHVAPTHLELSLPVSVKPLLTILETWPQIEYLRLYWSDSFKATGLLPQTFRRNTVNGPISPNLRVIHIDMDGWGKQKVRNWAEVAVNIMKDRIERSLPISKITWTVYNQGKALYTNIVTRERVKMNYGIMDMD